MQIVLIVILIVGLGTLAIAHIHFESAPSLLHFSNTFTSIHCDVDHGSCLCVSERALLHVLLEIV